MNADTASATDTANAPGRSCPLHYRYAPSCFARPAEAHCEVLYVVGGLYGNGQALDEVLRLFAAERGSKRLVFNGDFHWFDTDPALFARVNDAVLAHDALRGNVETELADPDADPAAGCGCAYPDWVGDGVVERSNRILQALRHTAHAVPGATARMAALPMHRRVDVGPLRVAIVHGDATSLAGWGFAQEHLQDPAHRETVRTWFEQAQVDAFACSHTCAPVFNELPVAGRARAPLVLNNGAAGMPNLRGDTAGLLTRIALRPFTGRERRHGLERDGVFIEAIAIEGDHPAWLAAFRQMWPSGSDAELSYGARLRGTAGCEPAQAWPERQTEV